MAKLRLLSPANSLNSVRVLARAGTDEIYIGLDEPVPGGFNFSGRIAPVKTAEVSKINPNERELQEVVKFAHDHGVQVNLASNNYSMMDDPDGGGKFRDMYFRYVEKGIKAGVDAIIVGDISNIIAVRERGITKEIHASSFLSCQSIGFIRFLKELGCQRVCFPYQMKLSDYEVLSKEPGMEYEVFGHFSCSNLVGQCRMMHSIGPNMPVPLPCRNFYCARGGAETSEPVRFLDSGQDCAVCSLPDLVKLNLHVIKTTGRDVNIQIISMVTMIYRKCIDAAVAGAPREELQKIARSSPMWQDLFCKEGRCEYRGLAVEKSYI